MSTPHSYITEAEAARLADLPAARLRMAARRGLIDALITEQGLLYRAEHVLRLARSGS